MKDPVYVVGTLENERGPFVPWEGKNYSQRSVRQAMRTAEWLVKNEHFPNVAIWCKDQAAWAHINHLIEIWYNGDEPPFKVCQPNPLNTDELLQTH